MTAIIQDTSKRITQNIEWTLRNGVGPWAYFDISVQSNSGWPLIIKGGYSADSRKLSFALVWQGYGRIYGLCLGYAHSNLNRQKVESPHKHRWTEQDSHFAFPPPDITATANAPSLAWSQFCEEGAITHSGSFSDPPPVQTDFL